MELHEDGVAIVRSRDKKKRETKFWTATELLTNS